MAQFFWNNGNARIENNIICENDAGVYGGALGMDSCSSPTLINNTIVNNSSVEESGGIDVCFNSNPEIYNTILWGNTALEGNQLYISTDDCSPNFYYSDIQGGQSAFGGNPFTGNYISCIDSTPLFVETGDHPYSLTEDSPCIDTGTPDTTGLSLFSCDIIGNIRIWDGDGDGEYIIDIGAYEYDAPPWVSIGDKELSNEHKSVNLITYPNPFTTSTTLSYTLDKPENVQFTVYNLQSQIVFMMQEKQHKGEQKIQWNAEGLPAGMYYFRIQAGTYIGSGKIIKMD